MATQAQEKIPLALTNIYPQLATNALAITFSEMQSANDDGNIADLCITRSDILQVQALFKRVKRLLTDIEEER